MALDAITLLGSPDTVGAKIHSAEGSSAYNAPDGPFEVVQLPVDCLADAARALEQIPINAFVIRGAPVDPAQQFAPYRRSRPRPGEPPTFAPAAHHLLPIDWDENESAGEPRTDLHAVATEIRAYLPQPFHGAQCWVQATSSAGLKPGRRARLWFWLSRPCSDTEIKTWFNGAALEIDRAIYRPVQPIYVAAPRFQGVPDPFQASGLPRAVWLPGAEVVEVPLGLEVKAQATAHRDDAYDGAVDFSVLRTRGAEGTRATHLTSLAGSMRRRGMSPDEMAAALYVVNSKFPEPLPEQQVDEIAHSVGQYEPAAVAPPAPASTEAAEKAARKASRRLSEDAGLLPRVVVDLARHVRTGALSEGQALTAIEKGLAHHGTPIDRNALAQALTHAPAVEPVVPSWAAEAVLDEDGNPVNCPENLRLLLSRHPDFGLWFNSRSKVDYWDRCPWHDKPGAVLPTDDAALRAWISKHLGWHKAPANPLEMVTEVARYRAFDPWRNWLDGLRWDGSARLVHAAPHLFGCPDLPVFKLVFAWWLMQAVARSLRPGCQADYVLLLEGAQGIFKTSFLRHLVMRDEFFTRLKSGSDLDGPRTIGKIHGPVVVELAELAAMRRAEVESVKAFLDEREDRVQWLYARKPVNVARSCVFAATTNDDAPFQDVTGNRRWWPIPCGQINLELLLQHREQLWAEAVHLYRAGARYWPTADEEINLGLAALQAERVEEEPASNRLLDALQAEQRPGKAALSGAWIQAEYLDARGRIVRAPAAVLGEIAGLGPRDHRGIGRALRILGWTPLRVERNGARVRMWQAPDADKRGSYVEPTAKARPN